MSASGAKRAVFLFFLLLQATSWQGVAFASESFDLIVWHPFVGVQEKLFFHWVMEFGVREHLRIRVENGFDLNTALRKKANSREFPDVVVGPSDLLNVSDNVQLDALVESEFAGRKFIAAKGGRIAVRLFENGGHFLLRKKSIEIPRSRTELFSQLKNGKTIVWSNVEPLYLLSFLLDEERDNAGVSRALQKYRDLMLASNTPFPCDHRCLWNSIVERKADFAIVGDWLFPELDKANVGKDYALEPLPAFLGKCASLPYVAFFPSQAVANEKRIKASKRFVSWLSSDNIQEQVQRRLLQRPSGVRVRTSLWPSWMQAAVASARECSDVSTLATPEFWALSSAAVRQMGTKSATLENIVATFSKQLAAANSGDSRVGK